MKHIKLYEEFKGDLMEEQRKWLDEVVSGSWKVNQEEKVDVIGSVVCIGSTMEKIPVEFGKVSVHFDLENCRKLKSLKGCPREVGKSFDCDGCESLTTLKGAPSTVGGNFYCESTPLVPEEEKDLLDEESELFFLWLKSGMDLKDFMHQKRGLVKGKEFGF